MKLNIENAHLVLEQYLKEKNPKKYEHSLAVAEIAEKLARKWRIHVEEAVIAALLHDVGKCKDREEMITYCEANGIKISKFERFENQAAVHGKISAHIFKSEFGGNENSKRTVRKIARAIESHVAGSKKMKLLDKVVFLADDLQSKKDGAKRLEEILREPGRKPDRHITKIIARKIENAERENRLPNDGLLNLIPKGSGGTTKRERFLKQYGWDGKSNRGIAGMQNAEQIVEQYWEDRCNK